MTATVNQEACIRCGVCAGLCPEVFTLPDNGDAAQVIVTSVAQPQQPAARDAADSCPTAAITIR